VELAGRQYRARRYRETCPDPARSETPDTHASTSHGNREIPRLPASTGEHRPRREAPCHKPAMNGRGKSDGPIVPGKPPNKAGQPAAEAVEGRGLAKGGLPAFVWVT
jgi:RNA-directed DNA polymerase